MAFTFFFYSSFSSPASLEEVSIPLLKLNKLIVLIISSDGFRFGFQHKTNTPNIHRLIQNGIEAKLGLIPIFPIVIFPNHYSIVTRLYPPYHDIIYIEPKWWLGEPKKQINLELNNTHTHTPRARS